MLYGYCLHTTLALLLGTTLESVKAGERTVLLDGSQNWMLEGDREVDAGGDPKMEQKV